MPNLEGASLVKCLTCMQNYAFCTYPSQVMRQLLRMRLHDDSRLVNLMC
jgi:hypothetical protein